MKNILIGLTVIFIKVALISGLKHHLVLTNDNRMCFSVSSFGYALGGRLDVVVKNLSLSPDPSESSSNQEFGFVLIKSGQMIDPTASVLLDTGPYSCMANTIREFMTEDIIVFRPSFNQKKVIIRCKQPDDKLPNIRTLRSDSRLEDPSHSGYIHTYTKRAAIMEGNSSLTEYYPEMRKPSLDAQLGVCHGSPDIDMSVHIDEFGRASYSFNFTMTIGIEDQQALYYLTFHNCRGRGHRHTPKWPYAVTKFNLSMLIYETNDPENYLPIGSTPLPQMYFIMSIVYFLMGCIWYNFISTQKDSALKIHYLMTVLVFAKACSLLFHSINYHYIAINGQPVVTWAYLYYATRSVKGALFFITLALIGSGWTFVKHILGEKDKQIILTIVGLQVIAHIAEILFDESTEGEVSYIPLAYICSMVDLFSCFAILYPIGWSVRHLEEASRTDGKAAINLKKLVIFQRFYIISAAYIYMTRIVAFIFGALLSYRNTWLVELGTELTTVIYFTITGYYFQPIPTNPYLLLSSENDLEENILFSMEDHKMQELEDMSSVEIDGSTVEGSKKRQVTRRPDEEIV